MIATKSVQRCALPGCEKPVPAQAPGARRKRGYCSNACRQKAYRERHHPFPKGNPQMMTFWEQAADAVEHLTQAQLYSLKQRIEDKLGRSTTERSTERQALALPLPAPARESLSRPPALS